MKYTVLGRSGISVSRISMGTHHLNDPADMDKHVQNFLYAYKKGINFFETSVTYGEGYSELILGEAVKEMKKELFEASADPKLIAVVVFPTPPFWLTIDITLPIMLPLGR